MDLELISEKFRQVCIEKGWSRDWAQGGCYLHLEVSELTEALRGKGNPVSEAGDVLFVLLSIMREHGIRVQDAITQVSKRFGVDL